MAKDQSEHDRRKSRVEREIREIVAEFLIRGFKTRLPGLVTITRVGVSGDFKSAQVFFSFFGSDQEREKAWELLDEGTSEVQRQVGRLLKIKFCPRITFEFDKGLEKALKVQNLIEEVERERRALEKNAVSEESDDESERTS